MRKAVKVIAITCAVLVALVAAGYLAWVPPLREPPYQLTLEWGSKGSAPGEFDDPTGIAVDRDEVFVADARNHRIQVFDRRGHFRRSFGADQLQRPMNLDIRGDRLYVSDYFTDLIQVFSLAGEHRGALGGGANLNSPGGVAARADGTLMVADTYGQRIVQLDTDGKVLHVWSGAGIGAGEFSYPTDVAMHRDGGFYVADGYNDRIQQFNADGAFVRKWGGPLAMNIYGPFNGWFTTVTSLAVAPDGAVFAADFYNDRIQKFSADGRFLTAFGRPPLGPGHGATAVAVHEDGTVYVTNLAADRVEAWKSGNRDH